MSTFSSAYDQNYGQPNYGGPQMMYAPPQRRIEQSSPPPDVTPVRQPQRWVETNDGLYDSDPSKYLAMNCLDIANHIKYCVVCRKLYSCDKTFYIVAIITLIVIIAILVRKIMENQ